MKTIKILLVEDERALAMIVRDTLQGQGFSVVTAHDGEEGLRLFFTEKPHVVVADIMMPRMDGFEMVRRLRRQNALVPVLFLTARSATDDVVEGFEAGANDYLKKPFSMQELIVRIKSLARREPPCLPENGEGVAIGRYRFYPQRQELELDGGRQRLSNRESEILTRLSMNRGGVVNMSDMLLDLWGDDGFFNTRSLHVFITKLRHKLSRDPEVRIVNVRGIGYKLVVE